MIDSIARSRVANGRCFGIAAVGVFILALQVALGTGCRNSQTELQLKSAQQAVESALAAWKKGDSPASLTTATPPVEFHDDDWKLAATLLEFRIDKCYVDSDGVPRCAVTLQIRQGQEPPREISVIYEIVNKGLYVIGRDPMSSPL